MLASEYMTVWDVPWVVTGACHGLCSDVCRSSAWKLRVVDGQLRVCQGFIVPVDLLLYWLIVLHCSVFDCLIGTLCGSVLA